MAFIKWGSNGDTDDQDESRELDPTNELHKLLLQDAADLFACWELESVPILLSSKGSRFAYNSGHILGNPCRIFLDFGQIDEIASASATSDQVLAVRFCLFHEITHYAQLRFVTQNHHANEFNKLAPWLAECHADLFGSYWMKEIVKQEVTKQIQSIAFAVGSSSGRLHPTGCIRANCITKSRHFAATHDVISKDRTVPECDRRTLMRDSMQTAVDVLFKTPIPCDAKGSYPDLPTCNNCSGTVPQEITEGTSKKIDAANLLGFDLHL